MPNRIGRKAKIRETKEVSRVSRIRGQVVETVSCIYNTENNSRLPCPIERADETLPISLLSLRNDPQQPKQRTEQNVVITESQINVNDSTIKQNQIESKTIRRNMRPTKSIRLLALESCLVHNFKIFNCRDGRWLEEVSSARRCPTRSNLQRRPRSPKQKKKF
ncbi:unnamed protein product [Brachionus calyciflorus]|uniref:Uncharacterized protein n=1 Tax=Brachionus calyciflorus TaxID=104777 RepID=A0A814E8M1_9BILA|nr:unnamed protein product [Brachionus calyciflorus]